MTDSADTMPNPPDPAATAPTGTSTGIDPKVGGLLAYALGWVSGLILFLIEKEHREVRYHAAQSILVSGALMGVWIVLSVLTFIPVLGLLFGLLGLLLGLVGLALWIYLMVQGYQLSHVRLPIVGRLAEQWVNQ